MRSVKEIIHIYKNGDFAQRTRITAKFSMFANFVTAAGKMILGVFTPLSLFLIISGLYSVGIGGCKYLYFRGQSPSPTLARERRYYTRMAVLLLTSSAIYIAYMVRLFFVRSDFSCTTITGIAIAAFAFFDMALAIKGLVKSNRRRDLLLSGLRTVCFSGALITLVLAQTAILSFTAETAEIAIAASVGNAVMGVIMGSVSCLLSVLMLIRSARLYREHGSLAPDEQDDFLDCVENPDSFDGTAAQSPTCAGTAAAQSAAFSENPAPTSQSGDNQKYE